MKRLSVLLLVICALPRTARAEWLTNYWENQHIDAKILTLTPELKYYSSTSNYSPAGEVYTPQNFTNYTQERLDFLAKYGFSPALSGYARLSATRATVSPAANGGSTLGLSDQVIGLSARVFKSDLDAGEWVPASIDLQGQIEFPLYNNTSIVSPAPYLGDQTTDWTLGGFLTIPLDQDGDELYSAVGGVGYTGRSSKTSALFGSYVPYSLDCLYRPKTTGAYANLGVFGVLANSVDPNLLVPISALSPLGSGGSYATGAGYPKVLNLRGKLGYQLDSKLAIDVAASKDIYGRGAPSGVLIAGEMTFRFDFRARKHAAHQTPGDYGKSNQGFVTYAGEAHVTRIGAEANQIEMDQGSKSGVVPGQIYDLFSVEADGRPAQAIARAKVLSAQPDQSILQIKEYFKEIAIQKGFILKRPVGGKQ